MSSQMRQIALLCASLLLCPPAASAAAGPEQRLSTVEPAPLSRKSAVVFDGRNFLVAWTDTFPNGGIRDAAFARVDRNGLLVDRPSISTGPSYAGAPPVMVSDGESTLIAWLEEVQKPTFPEAPSTFDLKITWVDAEARQIRPAVRIDTFKARTASVAATSTGLGFLIAYAVDDSVNAARLQSLSFLFSDTARVKEKTTGQGVLVASDGESAMFIWEEDERCTRPTDCESTIHGRAFNLALQPLLSEFETPGERLRALISTNVSHILATDTPTSWSVTSFDRRGVVLAERTSRGATAPALALVVNETFVFWQRGQRASGSDIYFLPLDGEFALTRDLRDDQALTLAAEAASEYDVAVAAAGSRVLAVYTKDEGNGSLIASRLVDASTLSSPPPTPAAPVVVSSTAGSRARVTLQWGETPGARRYRLQVSARERNDVREIIIEGGERFAVIDDLHTETPYEFRLIAEDVNGYSSPSSILRVTTARQGTRAEQRRRAVGRQ